ncbi:MAG: ThuA domain-containing protein, partial [Phycisphaeraceae bacterium]
VCVLLLASACAAPAVAEDNLHVHMISGSKEYRSEASLGQFQQLLQQRGMTVTASWGDDAGHDLPNIEAVAEADLLIIFTRRMVLPDQQLQYILDHFEAEKPAIGIRTSSHAFEGYPEMDAEIFGGDYAGHGDDEPVTLSVPDDAEGHAVLAGVQPWKRPGKIYLNRELGPKTEVLIRGIGERSDLDQPLVWTNHYGDSGKAFYTSLGMPHDFENPSFIRMLLNAIHWATHE